MNKTTDLNWTLVRTWAASQIIKPPKSNTDEEICQN